MSWKLLLHRVPRGLVHTLVLAAILAPNASIAVAAPSASQVGASRQRVARAVKRVAEASRRSQRIADERAAASARLDRIMDEQTTTRQRLTSRARAMYRYGDVSFVAVLLHAHSFEAFATRWQLLKRMNRRDTEDLQRLAQLRRQAGSTTARLMRLQAEAARSADSVERELKQARADLAEDESALRDYESQLAAAKRRAKRRPAIVKWPKVVTVLATDAHEPEQDLSGRGDWNTGTASHYGLNFSGRTASGERVGPYSMIIAHKTLPFGTLVEIEYRGERAVARVADRGPFTPGRDLDLGPGVARVLGFRGVAQVRWRVIER